MRKRLDEDLKTAMREKNTIALNTIRSIKTALLNEDTSVGKKRTDIDIIKMLAKQRKDAMEQYMNVGNDVLSEIEQKELSIIETYLPKQLSVDEITDIVKLYVEEIDEKHMKYMGVIMNRFNTEYPGQDGKVISNIVRDLLK